MKMRNYFKSALLASAFIVGFASCSNDDEIGGADLGDAVSTMVQVAITQSGPATYATEGATLDESKVMSVTLYIFNKNKVLEAVENLQTSLTKSFKLTTGMHYFYAALNVPSGLLAANAVTIGMPLNTFEKVVAENLAENTLKSSGFLMTNVGAPVERNLIVEATPSANKITIKVGRALAKVNAAFAPLSETGGGKLERGTVQYKIRNNPKKMYFMPVYEANVLKTPFFADVTPVPESNYFHMTSYSSALTSGFGNTALYTIENSNEIPRQGNSTHLMIQGKFVPEKLLNADGTGEGPALGTNGEFWRIRKADGTFTDKFYRVKPNTAQIGTGVAFHYDKGVCYYALWVADNLQTNATAKYTVKRNNFYKVTITSVSGPGGNSEDGDNGGVTDPEEELDAETQIKATIEILPWNVIDQSGGI